MNTQVKLITALLALTWLIPVPAWGADCLIPCPGDITGDCKVDMDDFLILSQNWLTDCSGVTALPVLKIIDVGISPAQASGLAKILGIPEEQLIFEKGFPVQFVDPQRHLAIPTVPVEDQQLIEELLKETEQDGQSEIAFEALDEKLLRAIVPVPPQTALSEVVKALQETGIALGGGEPSVSHSTFELMDTQGNLLLPAVQMDTRVQFNSAIQGVPIMGPGAKFSVSYNPQGDVTELLLARRGVEAGREMFPLINPQQAVQRAFGAEAAARFVPEQEAQLVYYAPPLSEQDTQTLIPHYDIGGIIFTPEGAQFHKLRRLIPAIADPSYVPTVGLEAWVEGTSLVIAQAFASGGQIPYRYYWHSTSTDLSWVPEDQSSVQYRALPRQQAGPETVTVNVLDKNGIWISASQTVIIGATGGGIAPLAGGVRDFGISRAVSDLGAANQSGFRSRFLNDGVTMRFNWTGASAWENDFKQPPAGADTTYVDNTDITFYIGHGYGGGFTFESNVDDGTLTYTDAAGAWGNYDIEWLALLSCQVLKGDYGGQSWATRWGPAFDGLHLLLGFQTNAYDWPNFGGRFADYALGRQIIFVTLPPLSIRNAWFQAKAEEQPDSVESVVMGVVGPGGILGGYNDYFWGKGPVSCDLRGSNIRGYWRQVYK